MTIEPIMSRDVHHCRPDQTLDYAALADVGARLRLSSRLLR